MIIVKLSNRFISNIKFKFNLLRLKLKWKQANANNSTGILNCFDISKVNVGNYTYGGLNVQTFNNPNEYMEIGCFCSIADEVKFLLGGEHSYTNISTFPFNRFVLSKKENTPTKGKIIIGDDVWIGYRSTILSGVTIGQGAVIAAGSVVYKDVPPYAIYGDGKVIKYRFSTEIIEKLIQLDFSKLTPELITENINFLYSELTLKSLENNVLINTLTTPNSK